MSNTQVVPVEWIGARSPIESDVVMFRILTGIYTETEEYWLKAMAAALSNVIRIDGKRARIMGPPEGLSRYYRWGHVGGSYVQNMTELDAERLFANPNMAFEFRNMITEPDKEPAVPEHLMNKVIWHCLEVARNGPGVHLTGDIPASVNKPIHPLLGTDSGQFTLPPREVEGFRY